MDKSAAEKTKIVVNACLANAESILSMAERELGKGADHVCFHLALLALEEVGKAILISVGYTVAAAGKEKRNLQIALDDHVKKIFWALWHGFLFKDKSSPKEIEEMQGLATNLHESRLSYLYTDPNNPIDSNDKLRPDEAKKLIDLTRVRLKMEKDRVDIHEFDSEESEELTWFFNAVEDKEKRVHIFSRFSLDKMKGFENGRDWIKWLHNQEKQNKEEMMRLAQQEMSRARPVSEAEKFEPKYRIRFRIQSHSHDIRDNAFSVWNKGVKDTKIYKTTSKNLPVFAKSELMIELILGKGVAPAALWGVGLFYAKTFVVAINIGTMGLFWWNMPKDVETYYDEIADLEADKNGNIKLKVVPEKRLMIDWGDEGRTLKKEDVGEVSLASAFLMYEHKKLENFIRAYAMGLTCFSKTDIHLRLEANAFEEFFKAFKAALIAFGDWDGKSDIKEAARNAFPNKTKDDYLESTLQMGLDLDSTHTKAPNITLTEVVGMKIYCDAYIKVKGHQYFEKKQAEKGEKTEQSQEPA